jgi:hypothetical protein
VSIRAVILRIPATALRSLANMPLNRAIIKLIIETSLRIVYPTLNNMIAILRNTIATLSSVRAKPLNMIVRLLSITIKLLNMTVRLLSTTIKLLNMIVRLLNMTIKLLNMITKMRSMMTKMRKMIITMSNLTATLRGAQRGSIDTARHLFLFDTQKPAYVCHIQAATSFPVLDRYVK